MNVLTMPPLRAAILGVATALGVAGCARPAPTDPRMVSEWTHALYGLVRAERLSPPVASRLFAYAAVALYEGMAAASPAMPSLAGTLNGLDSLPRARDPLALDQTLVAVAAEHTLLDSLFRQGLPTTQAAVARLADSLSASREVDPDRRERSTALGREIGLALVAWSRADGFAETRGVAYRPPTGPGLWINDSPPNIYGTQSLSSASQAISADDPSVALRPGSATDRALVMSRPKARDRLELPAVNMAGATEPYWGRLRPFLLTAWNECPVPEPPGYSTSPESPMYREAMELVALKAGQTPDQRTIALYWADNPGETAPRPATGSASPAS